MAISIGGGTGWAGVFDALFGEAFDLERRRNRRRLLWLVPICCIATAVALGLTDNRGPASSPIATNGHVSVNSVRLSASADYTAMSVVGGKLMLVDYGDSVPHAANGGTCRTAIVNPESLRMSSVTRGPCDDPPRCFTAT